MSTNLIAQTNLNKLSRGFVLPISLILLVIVTGIVAVQLQRALLDERLAANSRENVMADTSVQTMLRWCELQLTNAPDSVFTIPAPIRGEPAAWTIDSNWDPTKTFTVIAADLPGVSNPSCLVELASDELMGGISDSGDPSDPTGRARWLKFRITARVARSGGGFEHVQSELRLYRQ